MFVEHADIARIKPPIANRLVRFFGIAPIFLHHARRAHDDLPGFARIAIRAIAPNDSKIHEHPAPAALARCSEREVLGHHRRVTADLGLAIDLTQDDSPGLINLEQLPGHSCAAGGRKSQRRQVRGFELGERRDELKECRNRAEAGDPFAFDQAKRIERHKLRYKIEREALRRVLHELHEPGGRIKWREADRTVACARARLLDRPVCRISGHGPIGKHDALGFGGRPGGRDDDHGCIDHWIVRRRHRVTGPQRLDLADRPGTEAGRHHLLGIFR